MLDDVKPVPSNGIVQELEIQFREMIQNSYAPTSNQVFTILIEFS